MRRHVWLMALIAAACAPSIASAADYAGRHAYPRHGWVRGVLGSCVRTRVEAVGAPAGATPVIHYEDGVIQAFDGDMLGHVETKPGDPIQLCLVSFTRDCGEQDLPGRTYATGNLRTGAAWTLPDVRSSCAAH